MGSPGEEDAAVVPMPQDGGLATAPGGSLRLPPADQTLTLRMGDKATVTLLTAAHLGRLDVFLHMDTTASMGDEIDTLQRELLRDVVPRLQAQVPDVAFGVGRFEDFPVPPWGDAGRTGRPDAPFELLSPISQDLSAIRAAVFGLDNPLGQGGDYREAGAEALFQIGTGAGYRKDDVAYIDPFEPTSAPLGKLGGVGFRDHSLPVVLHITDAPSHAPSDYADLLPGTRGYGEAINALQGLGARVIAVVCGACATGECEASGADGARSELLALARDTGAVLPADMPCETGLNGAERPLTAGQCPAVFEVSGDGAGLSNALVESTVALLDGLSYQQVRAVATVDPLGFVAAIAPQPSEQPVGRPPLEFSDLRPLGAPDGEPDTVVNVHHGAELGFAITLSNTHVASLAWPQSFRVQLQVLGDDLVLRQMVLRIEVPAAAPSDATPAAADGGAVEMTDAGAPSPGLDWDAGSM